MAKLFLILGAIFALFVATALGGFAWTLWSGFQRINAMMEIGKLEKVYPFRHPPDGSVVSLEETRIQQYLEVRRASLAAMAKARSRSFSEDVWDPSGLQWLFAKNKNEEASEAFFRTMHSVFTAQRMSASEFLALNASIYQNPMKFDEASRALLIRYAKDVEVLADASANEELSAYLLTF